MRAEDFSSSLQVFSVSDNSSFDISVEVGTETLVVPTIFKNVQRSSAFSFVVRYLDVLLEEE